jgi:hypothetical protein
VAVSNRSGKALELTAGATVLLDGTHVYLRSLTPGSAHHRVSKRCDAMQPVPGPTGKLLSDVELFHADSSSLYWLERRGKLLDHTD